uniref:Uncharacterized protein n=1 Tax=Anguilla anguilla TaxID=7936 RepID=A0A0E9XM80_ANGAN
MMLSEWLASKLARKSSENAGQGQPE